MDKNRRYCRKFRIRTTSYITSVPIEIEAPFRYRKEWHFGCDYRTTNQTALALARFIAKFNGYRLVKEPKEAK